MAKVGYARVSSTGQSLAVQLEKLNNANCDKIFQEKRSGKTAARPEYQNCINYLRDGDTLVITRLDRLARSVVHLSQIANKFKEENINLVVTDQAIDTSTSTGRLTFNILATIAEFETDLRSERQLEGIAKAKAIGTKFGRKVTITEDIKEEIKNKRLNGVSAGDIAKELDIGVASVYRALNDES